MLRHAPRLVALLFLSSAAVACGASQVSTPRARVAADLGCTPDRTVVQRLSQNDWQVSGCGRTAVYVCTYPVRDCWRRGQITEEPSPTDPPPPQ